MDWKAPKSLLVFLEVKKGSRVEKKERMTSNKLNLYRQVKSRRLNKIIIKLSCFIIDTDVDGSELLHQLRLAVYPILYKPSKTSQVVSRNSEPSTALLIIL